MAKHNKKTKIFSALEVANICGVVNQTAINWIKNDYLKAFTTPGGQYRVYTEDLLAFLEARQMRIPPELQALLDDQNNGTFLIIDDDRDFNDMVKAVLQKAFPDYLMEQAFDGFEAGALLAKKKPAVVVLDLNLPGVNGLTLCRSIKNDPDLGKPVVMAVSGLDDPQYKEQVLNEGAEGFHSKPLDKEALISEIQVCLQGRA